MPLTTPRSTARLARVMLDLEGAIGECDKQLTEAKAAAAQLIRHIQLVQGMLPFAHLFAEADLAVHADVEALRQAEAFIAKHDKALEKLKTQMQVLRQNPQNFAALQAAYDEASELLAEQKRRCCALDQLVALHPKVLEVAAVGVPHNVSSELVKIFVVKKNTKLQEDEIIAHCRKHLTAYKLPKLVEFRNELPKTNVGKILRRVPRDEEIAKQ